MKKTIKLALTATIVLSATSAFATNGVNLMGIGAKSRAMGGTGVAQYQGAESGFNNPALIGYAKGHEVSVAGTYFSPDVSLKQSDDLNFGPGGAPQAGTDTSAAGASMLPAISVAVKAHENFAWGLALYGVAGMGVDYINKANSTSPENTTLAGGAYSNWLVMRFAVPLAYTTHGFSVGVAPIIQYGLLSVPSMGSQMGGASSAGGVASNLGLGYELGLSYNFEDAGIMLGADYKSSISQQYENVFNSNINPASSGTATQDKLATPASWGLGVSWDIMKSGNTIAFDYKNIQYGSTDGMNDFGWEDQSIYALGYEYAAESWAVRLGYNYGASPINTDVKSDGSNQEVVMGSLIQFPGVTESHYSIGGTFAFSEMTSMDLAYVYATGSADADIAFPNGMGGMQTSNIEATNDQNSFTAAVNFNF